VRCFRGLLSWSFLELIKFVLCRPRCGTESRAAAGLLRLRFDTEIVLDVIRSSSVASLRSNAGLFVLITNGPFKRDSPSHDNFYVVDRGGERFILDNSLASLPSYLSLSCSFFL
jgi:hypothetical protein